MILGYRDAFGFEQLIYHPASGTYGASIRGLISRGSLACGHVDTGAVAGYFSGMRLPGRTVLADFFAVPPGYALLTSPSGLTVAPRPMVSEAGDLESLLLASLERVLERKRPAAIALSGGLDSALLLAMLDTLGATHIPAYVLTTRLPGYDELDAALETARRSGVAVVVVEASEADFVDAVPDAMRHLEEPLFNLHPVAKLLLARAMRRDGIELAISGDGADQVLRRDTSADYLPLCRTLFRAEGIELVPPFLDGDVVAHMQALPPDPEKTCLRVLGRRFGVSSELTDGPKRVRLAPPMNIDHLLPRPDIEALAAQIGTATPALTTDAERVQWATLRLLLADLGVAG
ncbi:asparagine synthase-related protein [Luteibacter sp. UNCMF366Tsu5.1]|uniref:asparagine synthase-related protein n=1 Tax=Luteibacter sp. UNCMF366Tsu5.1 TaxID=1502758 RepID=UPI000908E7EF|nr:asparagine synthase-related protein [Luteibacter sp. UNCMF366Tsu5.1]SFW24014.1 Asparagine synthase [Luteibacter sp. UNCMF366Tsu5.1]